MMKGPIRDLIAVGGQDVKVRLPEGLTVIDVKVWKSEEKLQYRISDGYLETTVPSILEHEVLAIDF